MFRRIPKRGGRSTGFAPGSRSRRSEAHDNFRGRDLRRPLSDGVVELIKGTAERVVGCAKEILASLEVGEPNQLTGGSIS